MSTTTSSLRLPATKKPIIKQTSPAGDYQRLSLALLTVALTLGTAYSVLAHTYLDTSNPLIANLPHPAHNKSYFARKSNVFNQVFVKRAWGWTVGVSLALVAAGRR